MIQVRQHLWLKPLKRKKPRIWASSASCSAAASSAGPGRSELPCASQNACTPAGHMLPQHRPQRGLLIPRDSVLAAIKHACDKADGPSTTKPASMHACSRVRGVDDESQFAWCFSMTRIWERMMMPCSGPGRLAQPSASDAASEDPSASSVSAPRLLRASRPPLSGALLLPRTTGKPLCAQLVSTSIT